ncbi:MAG TPA: hypothetical protein VIZ18_07815 [Ktedonobacteraceae bacterium]
MSIDERLNREYNGWENRFTWLVHLHLSNEYVLNAEITQMVAGEPNDGPAGRLVEMWVKLAVAHWMNQFSGRNRVHDRQVALLVWDVLGSALAYAEWDDLVGMLAGDERVSNTFTMTLHRCIQSSRWLHSQMARLLRDASSAYAAADAMKAWFEAVLADWIDKMAIGQTTNAHIMPVFEGLIQNTYGLIFWEHVARAFRPEY